MLNFVLCDDNEIILTKFSKMLDSIFWDNNLDGNIALSTSNPNEALQYVRENPVDVIILDIDFKSNVSGIDIANQIRNVNKKAYIIFATGHLEYLILAYKCKTFDYLPKPISMDNLKNTILRLFNDITDDKSSTSFIQLNKKNTIIKSDSICYIEKDSTKLIFRGKNIEHSIYSSFNKIQDELPPNFVRCHKSYIVNIQNVESIENNIIHFDKANTLSCSIGQVYKKKFLEVFNNELNTAFNDT